MIICCGEALVDRIPVGDSHDVIVGGSIINTARAAARLGVPVAYVSSVSNDAYGDQIHASLKSSGVDMRFARRVDRPTTVAHVTLKDGNATYRFEDDGSAIRMMSRDELPAALPNCQLVHCGSISLASEPCGSTIEQFVTELRATSVVAIDPNIRPGFATDESAYRKRVERLLRIADIVKLSDEDLAWFDEDETSFVVRCLAYGVSVVFITQGGEGASVSSNAGRVFLPGRAVDVADTVGAGDAFSAGIYYALHERDALSRERLGVLSLDELAEILQLGIDVSARVVQVTGAELPVDS